MFRRNILELERGVLELAEAEDVTYALAGANLMESLELAL